MYNELITSQSSYTYITPCNNIIFCISMQYATSTTIRNFNHMKYAITLLKLYPTIREHNTIQSYTDCTVLIIESIFIQLFS